MKRVLFIFVILTLISSPLLAENATSEGSTTTKTDNSETFKIEESNGTNLIITGNGDNVIHYNSPEESKDGNATSSVVIQQNDSMEAFVIVMSFPVFKNDGMKNTFTELIIPLYYDGTWDLLWFEE